jgi:hypothetical protein
VGEEWNIEKIEVYKDFYQIDIREEDARKSIRSFIRKDALFALICVAEKEHIDEEENARMKVVDNRLVTNGDWEGV